MGRIPSGRAALRPNCVRSSCFLPVGAANTGFSILVYWAMLWAGLAMPLASLVSLVVGILISFTTQSRFVFDNRDPWKLLPYFIVWSILYAFYLGLTWLLMRCGLDAYAAGFCPRRRSCYPIFCRKHSCFVHTRFN